MGNVRDRFVRLAAAFGLLATMACGARLDEAQYLAAPGAGDGGERVYPAEGFAPA